MRKIEFYRHNISRKDIQECATVLKSIFLTTGDKVKLFEDKLSACLGAKYAVAVTSCTEALFLSLMGIGIKPGDEVITTPLSFVATANAIEYCLAKPVFVDVEKNTGNIDPSLIEKSITKRTRAILPVHLYGHMADMKKISLIAKKYKLKIIEDSAHCIEGKRDGIRPGQLSNSACFSFYATKNITSGEGGAIVTNGSRLYKWLLMARLHGISKNASERYNKMYEHYDMEFLGYKANMSDISAALLLNQLEKIDKFWVKKERIAKYYNHSFRVNSKIKIPKILPNVKHARLLYTILVDPNKRDKIIHMLQKRKIGVAVNFRPIHLMKFYRKKYNYKPENFPVAEKIGSSTISLPFYPKLKRDELKYIVKTVNELTKV